MKTPVPSIGVTKGRGWSSKKRNEGSRFMLAIQSFLATLIPGPPILKKTDFPSVETTADPVIVADIVFVFCASEML